jgi:hypothetical protein
MVAFVKIVLFFLEVIPTFLLLLMVVGGAFLLLSAASRRLAARVAPIINPFVRGVWVRPFGAALTIGASLAGALCFGQGCILLIGRLEWFSFLAPRSSKLPLPETLGLLVLSLAVTLAGLLVFRVLWCNSKPFSRSSRSLQCGLLAGGVSLYVTLVRLALLPRWSDIESLEFRLAGWARRVVLQLPEGFYVLLLGAAGCALSGMWARGWRSSSAPRLTPGLHFVAMACGLQYIFLYSIACLRFAYISMLFVIALGLSLVIVAVAFKRWLERSANDLEIVVSKREPPRRDRIPPPEFNQGSAPDQASKR